MVYNVVVVDFQGDKAVSVGSRAHLQDKAVAEVNLIKILLSLSPCLSVSFPLSLSNFLHFSSARIDVTTERFHTWQITNKTRLRIHTKINVAKHVESRLRDHVLMPFDTQLTA